MNKIFGVFVLAILFLAIIGSEILASSSKASLSLWIQTNAVGMMFEENIKEVADDFKRTYQKEKDVITNYNVRLFWKGEKVVIKILLVYQRLFPDLPEVHLKSGCSWFDGLRLIVTDVTEGKKSATIDLRDKKEFVLRDGKKLLPPQVFQPETGISIDPIDLDELVGGIKSDHLYRLEVIAGKEFFNNLNPVPGLSTTIKYVVRKRPKNPRDEGIRLYHLASRITKSNPQEAERMYLEAIEKDASLQLPRYGLLGLYEKQKRYEEAYRILESWIPFASEIYRKKIDEKMSRIRMIIDAKKPK